MLATHGSLFARSVWFLLMLNLVNLAPQAAASKCPYTSFQAYNDCQQKEENNKLRKSCGGDEGSFACDLDLCRQNFPEMCAKKESPPSDDGGSDDGGESSTGSSGVGAMVLPCCCWWGIVGCVCYFRCKNKKQSQATANVAPPVVAGKVITAQVVGQPATSAPPVAQV